MPLESSGKLSITLTGYDGDGGCQLFRSFSALFTEVHDDTSQLIARFIFTIIKTLKLTGIILSPSIFVISC